MTAPVPVKLPPGFFRNGTEYESAGRWYDGNLVRWQNDRIRPWGGWVKASTNPGTPLAGIARSIITWRANNGFRYTAIGTNSKLYLSGGGAFSDVSPAGLVAGRPDAVAGPGFGAAAYGEQAYGTQRTSTGITLDADFWSFDLWGENVECVLSSDGGLWELTPSGTVAAVANAPTSNIGVLVTDETFVFLLGSGGNKRRVAWCAQGNNTLWLASATNTAGGVNLVTQGNIVTGRKLGSIPLIFTTEDVHAATFLGPPLIYRFDRIGENCGVASANAIATDTNTAYWMGLNGFFVYDGTVRTLPCEVQDYVFNNINVAQRSKIFVGRNSQDGELIWFYPSKNSLEVDSYVVYNYFKQIWYFGTLARTCWADRGTYVNPLAVDPNGVVFEHEVGLLADGVSRNGQIFLQSGPAEIADGERIIYANLMLPDAESGDALQVRFKMKTAPNGRETDFGPYPMTPNAEGYVPVRVAGRQAAVRVEQIADENWSFGKLRFLIAGGGKR